MIFNTKEDFKRALIDYKKVFSLVRVLDDDCIHQCHADEKGNLQRKKEPCFSIWDREKRCENCTSKKALEGKCQKRKFEFFNNKIYMITSVYANVRGEDKVIELVDTIDKKDIQCFKDDPALIDFLNDFIDTAYIDPLTGVFNRRFYDNKVETLSNVTAVAMLDLDHFKDINDSYGHDAGDSVILQAANAIKNCIRKSDAVIRYGGDEFVIVFQGMKAENLNKKLEEIRVSITNIRVSDYPGLRETATIGGYYCGKFDKEALKEADRAMYEAKKQRNCVVVAYKEMYAPKEVAEAAPVEFTAEQSTKTEEEIANQKRKVLVVEDNRLNREIMAAILSDEYEVLQAKDGKEGLEILSKNYRNLSIVLLDVYMPVCNGFEFLSKVKNDALLSSVPVIVTTGSEHPEDEEKCLDLGASDFVRKPYNPKVVLGRVHSIIKLKESVSTLSVVEFDSLTGLYTMPAFYHHAEQLIGQNANTVYNLIVADLRDFKLINSFFGVKKGNEVLVYLGRTYRSYLNTAVAARNGDKFFFLLRADKMPSKEDFYSCLNKRSNHGPIQNINIKYGFYRNIDKNQSVSILCDRATMAATSIKNDYNDVLAYYTDEIGNQLVKNQRLENDFDTAIKTNEFIPYFQPQVDSRTGKIISAEALVRWVKADGTMIIPGDFVPLFEQDGLIGRLDEHIFTKVCMYQKDRLEKGLKVVPISVNLSRNSVYRHRTLETYMNIVEKTGVPIKLVPIELTESASTGSKRLTETVVSFAKAGFLIYMDDFGTGYSSLMSLSELPFSELKLDKSLIDRIGTPKGEIILKHTIGTAKDLGLIIVAEGVEDRAQIEFLQSQGCFVIQGYYYSAPRSRAEFTEMLNKGNL